MNKLTSIRIKQEDGSYSEEYPVSVLAENVVWEQGQSNSLVDILGQVSFSTNGSIQHQIDVLDNKKFNTSDLNTYLAGQISTDVASWLNTNVNPVGSAVAVDESLSISGAAADAKITGDSINNIKSAIDNIDYEIYDSVSDMAYWKQGTPVNSSSASRITTDLYLNKTNIVGIVGIPSDMYGVLYAWNNGVSVGYYKTDGTFTATISEAYKLNGSYIFKEIMDQFPNYDFQITLGKYNGSNITPAVASNILFYKSRLDIIAADIDELNDITGTNTNTLFITRNDLAYVQGTPTNASSTSRITLAFPIERSVKTIYTNRTGLFFRIYAYNGAKHVGYLTASNTFSDSIGQAKSFTSVDMSTIWAVSELYDYVIVVQYTTDVTPADGQYIYFLYSMMANANETKSFVENRNIVCFGDSIFGIFRDKNYLDESIPHMVSQATGASCYNAGFGGTRAEESGAVNDVICFTNLVSAIINNDWTDIDAYVAGQQQYIQDTIAGLKQIDFAKVDIITVAYGTNDWASGVTTAAYKTALKSGITAMITAYPNLRAVLLTPIIRFIGGDGQSTWDYTTDDDRAVNSTGYKLPDFAETCVEAAKELHMPCVDNYWHLGINEQNKVTFFGNTANVHPNREGRKLIAERLVRAIT